MSIDYFGVTTTDPKRIGELVESPTPPADIAPIDVKAMHTLLKKQTRLKGAPGKPLTFTAGEARVTVYVTAASVQLNHNTAGDFDDIMDVVMDTQFALTKAGLNIWDPQGGKWFPGSPVLGE